MDARYLRLDAKSRLNANIIAQQAMAFMVPMKDMAELAELSCDLLSQVYDNNEIDRSSYERAVEICSIPTAPNHELREYHMMMMRILMDGILKVLDRQESVSSAVEMDDSQSLSQYNHSELNYSVSSNGFRQSPVPLVVKSEPRDDYLGPVSRVQEETVQESYTHDEPVEDEMHNGQHTNDEDVSIGGDHSVGGQDDGRIDCRMDYDKEMTPITQEPKSVKRQRRSMSRDSINESRSSSTAPSAKRRRSPSSDNLFERVGLCSEDALICPYCSHDTATYQLQEKHQFDMHQENLEYVYGCISCSIGVDKPWWTNRLSSARTHFTQGSCSNGRLYLRSVDEAKADNTRIFRRPSTASAINPSTPANIGDLVIHADFTSKEACTCPYCGEEFGCSTHNVKHQASVHNAEREDVYGCSNCSTIEIQIHRKWWRNLKTMRYHFQQHCSNATLLMRTVEEAIADPNRTIGSTGTNRERTPEEMGLKSEEALTCPYCREKCANPTGMLRHQYDEHKSKLVKVYGCTVCSKVEENSRWFKTLQQFKDHFKGGSCNTGTLIIRSVEEAREEASADCSLPPDRNLSKLAIKFGLSVNEMECPYCKIAIKPSKIDVHIRENHTRLNTFGCATCDMWWPTAISAAGHIEKSKSCKLSVRTAEEIMIAEPNNVPKEEYVTKDSEDEDEDQTKDEEDDMEYKNRGTRSRRSLTQGTPQSITVVEEQKLFTNLTVNQIKQDIDDNEYNSPMRTPHRNRSMSISSTCNESARVKKERMEKVNARLGQPDMLICPYCSLIAGQPKELIIHQEADHNSVEEGAYLCNHCNTRFNTVLDVKRHLLRSNLDGRELIIESQKKNDDQIDNSDSAAVVPEEEERSDKAESEQNSPTPLIILHI